MFFDSIGNFFGNVKNFFVGAKDYVVDKVSSVWNGGKEIVSGVVETGKQVVTTLHDDVVGYAKGVKEVATGIVNKTGEVVTHAEDTVGDVGKAFSWPLTMGAVVLGGAYLMGRR